MVKRASARGALLLRDTGLLFRLTAEKAGRDGIGLTASALGFVTVLSLVPLLAAFLFIGARTFSEYQPKVIELLAGLMPYSEAALAERLEEFLLQAQSVRGVGVLFFILTALTAFSTVERAINRAWGLSRKRPFRQKLQSFTLLLFWGSLLLGSAFSVAVNLGRDGGGWLALSGTLRVLTSLLLLAGLTMLYWLVPYTKVGFRFALLGGAVATLLLEILRASFTVYVNAFTGFELVYGSFAVALFFMVSIQLAWLIVLAGNQLTYVAQHFEALVLARRRRSGTGLRGPWLGLAAVTLLAIRLNGGKAVTSAAELGRWLKVSPEALRLALTPLIRAHLVTETTGGFEAFVLGRAPAHLKVEAVFHAYDPTYLPDPLQAPIEEVRQLIQAARSKSLEGRTVADFIPDEAADETDPPEPAEEHNPDEELDDPSIPLPE